jgi:hypothetical protein
MILINNLPTYYYVLTNTRIVEAKNEEGGNRLLHANAITSVLLVILNRCYYHTNTRSDYQRIS